MDPVTLATVAVTFAGSCIAQKCADATIEATWARMKSVFRGSGHTDPDPDKIDAQASAVLKTGEPTLISEAERVFHHAASLRRARLLKSVLEGARVLWVDDHPTNNTWERALFRTFGVEVTTVEKTESAVASLRAEHFDVVISDIKRGHVVDEGMRALPALRAVRPTTPVVFYTGVSRETHVPAGAFGLTTTPGELLNLLLDCLERTRI